MPRAEENDRMEGGQTNTRPSGTDIMRLDARRSGAKRKHELPEIGAMFGKLRIERFDIGERGGIKATYVSCQCSEHTHIYQVDIHNILSGKSTQCRYCADVERGKRYNKYAPIIPNLNKRTVTKLEARIAELERELHDLRHPELRAQAEVHDMDG